MLFLALAALEVRAAGTGASMETGSSDRARHSGSIIGVEGAINIASSDVPNSTSSTKFTGGAYYDMKLGDMVHFRPELLYLALSPDYLALPLMFGAKFDTGT